MGRGHTKGSPDLEVCETQTPGQTLSGFLEGSDGRVYW